MAAPGDSRQATAAVPAAPHHQKTYAGLAAAAGRTGGFAAADSSTRRSPAGGSSGSGSRGYSGKTELAGCPPTSAFFKPAQAPGQRQRQQRGPSATVSGSVTPPAGRPLARISTPDAAASPFLDDDDILFQMSGLKPLRTSSRTAQTPAGASGPIPRSQRKPQVPASRTQEALAAGADGGGAAAAAARRPPLSQAFAIARELSPRAGAPPAPTGGPGADGTGDSSRQRSRSSRPSESGVPTEAVLKEAAELLARVAALSPSSELASGMATAAPSPQVAPAHAAGMTEAGVAASLPEAAPAPGWSEELLNWMLNEKAGLLVEAQRAARRQQELEAELSLLAERSSSAEREAQRLTAERRSLLDRVQQLSAAEAAASARVERLAMENDALNAELERSQEVCREMLAARRAARDALSEMSAQNARLLAAYVDKKQEAAQLREALLQQQQESEARICNLEAQLQAAQASRRSLLGSLCSPPASPPSHAGSPASDCGVCVPEDGIATPRGLQPEDHGSASEAASPSSSGRRSCRFPEQMGGSPPQLNNENANAAGNVGAGSGSNSLKQQAGKAQWDEERFELLTLLERLQGQLQAHAEQQEAVARECSPLQQRQQQQQQQQSGMPGSFERAAPTSPYDQPFAGRPCAAEPEQQQQPGSTEQPSMADAGVNSSGEGSFEDGSGADCAGYGSPAVVAHHVAESPLPPPSGGRSGAPSPPSARSQQPSAAAVPTTEAQHAPAPCAASSEPIQVVRPAQRHWRRCSEAEQQQELAGEQAEQPSSQPQPKLSTSANRTLEAFLSCSPCEPSAAEAAAADAAAQAAAAAEQQRCMQAEQRAAELEAEVERLRQANAVAEQKMQREERRRAAEGAKAAGNAAFQAQDFEAALKHYTAGLEGMAADGAGTDPALAAVLHCNRAAAHQACGRYLHALADCFHAELLDPTYARVYHRRADAYWAVGAWDAAARDLARLVELGSGQDAVARLAEAQRRAQAGQPASHYAVLGVKPAATPGEVKSAYRQLALVFHPDKAGQAAGLGLGPTSAHALFKLLSEAAAVLGDAEQRRHHDIATLRHKYRRHYAAAAF